MKRNLARYKNNPYVFNAKSCEEVRDLFLKPEIMDKYGCTLDGQSQFYIDTVLNTNFAFTIFGSKLVMDLIKENIKPCERKFLVDGTFDCMPKYYHQLLIIAVEYKQNVSNR